MIFRFFEGLKTRLGRKVLPCIQHFEFLDEHFSMVYLARFLDFPHSILTGGHRRHREEVNGSDHRRRDGEKVSHVKFLSSFFLL